MKNRVPALLPALLLALALCVAPAAAGEALEPDALVQREIGQVVDAIVSMPVRGDTSEVLARIDRLEAAADGSRETLLLQIAIYLRDAKGTESAMGAALLLEHLDYSAQEIADAVEPHLGTDDSKLRAVLQDLLPEPVADGPVQQARTLIDGGELDEAERLLERALYDPKLEAEALILLTEIYVIREEYAPGIEYGKRAIAAAPESSYAHLRYAQALRTKLRQISRARAIFSVGPYKKELRKAIELDPNNVEARSEEIGYLMHAPGIAGGSMDKAGERIDELEKLDWREAMLQRLEYFGKQEKTDELLGVYRRLIERYPLEEWMRQGLAMTLQSIERYEESDEQFLILLESEDPRRSQVARYQMARSRILGRYDQEQAAALLLQYIDKMAETPREGIPQETHAYWRLGMAYEQLQRVEQARGAYQRAIEFDSENKDARAALKQLPRG